MKPTSGNIQQPDVRRLTEENLDSGLYCAEAVVSAVAKANGIHSDLIPRMATAFCSGMSRTCGTCGALTGATMGVSLVLGRSSPREPVRRVYEATQKLVEQFETEFGSRDCARLLECDISTSEGVSKFEREALYSRCERYTERAAELAHALIIETAFREGINSTILNQEAKSQSEISSDQ